MKRDPIVEEVRTIRDGIAREYNYDLGAIFRMLREVEAKSGREHVSPPLPPVEPLPEAAQLAAGSDVGPGTPRGG
ncbi:MAG: hypothetical protein JW940_18070 [Polyangiaceae bacterium]|nr:hypothetical protein [Polyangiaceae bacterium]